MKRILVFVLVVLFLSSCIKHYEIKPLAKKIYYNEFELRTWEDYNSESSNCFYSLDGYTLSLKYMHNDDDYNKIDFGLKDSGIGSPESSLFWSVDKDFNSKNWPKINKGKFSMTSLSKSDFDTLTNIESVKDLAIKGKTAIAIKNEDVIAFNLSRGFGLLYVKNFGAFTTTLHVKYYIEK